MAKKYKNIFGEPLEICSNNPMTGFYRDGCCGTGEDDVWEHTVCIIATEEFLVFSKVMGNDLSTPVPQYAFPGVKPGDRWCMCAKRWVEAYKHNCAPQVVLEATNETLLNYVSMDILLKYAYYADKNNGTEQRTSFY